VTANLFAFLVGVDDALEGRPAPDNGKDGIDVLRATIGRWDF
jgi:hypothetical protein